MTKAKRRVVFLALALISAIALSVAIFPIRRVEAQQTRISIAPSEVIIGNVNDAVPLDGIPFKVNITVSDVTFLFAWQIRVYYFPAIVNFTAAELPPGHVFDGRDFVPIDPSYERRSESLPQNLSNVNIANPVGSLWKWMETKKFELTRWVDSDTSGDLSEFDIVWLNVVGADLEEYFVVTSLQLTASTYSMTVESSYVQCGNTLLEPDVHINVTGTKNLAQLSFKGIATGNSIINFSRPLDTMLLDSNLEEISVELFDSSVTVLGPETELPQSTIKIQASPSAAQVDSNVTISGSIDPAKTDADVTISIKPQDGTWSELAKVKTKSDGSYTYQWKTSSINKFELQSSWQGDQQHKGAKSEIITVDVTEGPPPLSITEYLPYIAAAVVVVIVVVALVYFMKLRKR